MPKHRVSWKLPFEDFPFIDEGDEIDNIRQLPPPRIAIRVIKRNHAEILFAIKRTMPMIKLKHQVASQLEIPVNNLCLLHREKYIRNQDTADSLAIRHNDAILAFELTKVNKGDIHIVENNQVVY